MSDRVSSPASPATDSAGQPSPIVVSETRFLRLVKQSGWDFVQRKGSSGVVTAIAMTPAGEVVLVEQYRIPVGADVIEFPAGLAGDLVDASDESLLEAAQRELEEETGYAARRWQHVITSPSSAGLTDEMVAFFVADELYRSGPGGGDDSESIRVHEVPLAEIDQWLADQQAAGKMLDARLYTGLYLLRQQLDDEASEGPSRD